MDVIMEQTEPLDKVLLNYMKAYYTISPAEAEVGSEVEQMDVLDQAEEAQVILEILF